MNSLPENNADIVNYTGRPDLLQGRVIAVTGAGDGIGRAAALSFAAHGATVILMGRTVPKLESVYDEIEKNGHPQAAIYPIDFQGATEQDYEDMAVNLGREFEQLDGILHNAAMLGPRTPLSHYAAEAWENLLKVNCTAPFLMTRVLLPLLEKTANPSVVFTGSSVGYRGRAFWGAYAVSKAAVENLMQILSDELADTINLRVNSINPGATRTRMRASAYPAENPKTLKTPADIMPVYLYLMGDDSVGVTGQQYQAQLK